MIEFWDKEVEKRFFAESVKFATAKQLFYVTDKTDTLPIGPKAMTARRVPFKAETP